MEIPITNETNKPKNTRPFVTNGVPTAIARRNLTQEACKKWGYHSAMVNDEQAPSRQLPQSGR